MWQKRKLFSFLISVSVSSALASNLNETINYTLKTNPDVLISIRQRQQSDALMRQDEAGYLPSVDISGQDGSDTERNQNTANTFNGQDQFLTLNSTSTTAAITENIFSGFKTYFNVRADLATIASKRYSVNSTAQNTALAVGEVYLNVLRAQQLVAIAQKNVDVNIYTHDIIAKRVTRGLSSESELQQAEGRLALARSDLLQEQKGQQDAQAQFIQVVGVAPENLSMPDENLAWQKPNSQKEAIEKAIRNNPALQASRYNLNSAIETHKSAMSPYYPSVDVVASTTRGNNIGGTIGPNDADTIYVQANMNLFRGGADYQRVKQTAYQEQEAFDTIQKIEREVVSNTALAWNAWQTSINDLIQLQIHKDQSAKVALAFRKQYVVGKRTLVDLLNAENESFRAQSAYVDGKFNILLNQYRLLNSEGLILSYFHSPLPSAATTVEDAYKSKNYHQIRNNELYVSAQPPIDNSNNPGTGTNQKFSRHDSTNVTNSNKSKAEVAALKPNYTVSLVPVIQPSKKIATQPKSTSPAPKKEAIVSAEIKPTYSVTPVTTVKPAIKPIAEIKPNYQVLPIPSQVDKKSFVELKPTYTIAAVPTIKSAPKTLAAVKPTHISSPVAREKIAEIKPNYQVLPAPSPSIQNSFAALKPNYTVTPVESTKIKEPKLVKVKAAKIAEKPSLISKNATATNHTLALIPTPSMTASLPNPNAELPADPDKIHYKTTYTISKVTENNGPHHFKTTYSITKVPHYS